MPFDFRPAFGRALPYAAFLQAHGTAENRARWKQLYDSVKITAQQTQLLASFRRKMYVLCLSGPWCGDCVNACPIFQRFAEHAHVIDLRFINREHDFAAAQRGQVPLQITAPSHENSRKTRDLEEPAQAGAAEDPDDIRSRPMGKILVKWGILTAERVEKALLVQEEQKARGLNVRIGDVMTDMGFITSGQRDQALAAQNGYASLAAWDVAVAKELSLCGAPRVPVLVFLSEDWFECARFGERTLHTYREKARKHLSSLEGASCPTGLMAPDTDALTANIAEWLTYFERVQWMLLTSPRLAKLHGEV
jgi:thiol-disulfide isomerase/thioredoxin